MYERTRYSYDAISRGTHGPIISLQMKHPYPAEKLFETERVGSYPLGKVGKKKFLKISARFRLPILKKKSFFFFFLQICHTHIYIYRYIYMVWSSNELIRCVVSLFYSFSF